MEVDGVFHLKLKPILAMRKSSKGGHKITEYYDFVQHFLSVVVGKRTYAKKCHVERISTFVTPSDEALAILLYENSYDRWIDMAKKRNTKKSTILPKYTNGGESTGVTGSSKKYGGWSLDGIERFNELYDLVKANCESDKAKGYPFEEAFCIYSLELFNDNASNKRKRDDADDSPVRTISVKNDLWSDDEDDVKDDDDASEGSTEEEEEVEEANGLAGPVTQVANL